MNFGKWIVVAFVLFTLFIGSLVTVCMQQDINLVSIDYYQQELVHQQKINLVENAKTLQFLPEITIQGSVVTIKYRDFGKVENGELQLFRPSDSNLDRKFLIKASGSDEQHFPLEVYKEGLYRASMKWTMDGKDFYFEKLIVL